jgi:hypothetical protein
MTTADSVFLSVKLWQKLIHRIDPADLQGPRQVRDRRVPLPARVRPQEPAQDGPDVGGKGNAEPDPAAQRRNSLPGADTPTLARSADGLHRDSGLASSEITGGSLTCSMDNEGYLHAPAIKQL